MTSPIPLLSPKPSLTKTSSSQSHKPALKLSHSSGKTRNDYDQKCKSVGNVNGRNSNSANTSVLRNYLPSSALLSSSGEMDEKGTGWQQNGSANAIFHQSTTSKVILRLKRKRTDNLEWEEFYLPEKKRKKMDAVLEKLCGMHLDSENSLEGAKSENSVEKPQQSQERHSTDSETPLIGNSTKSTVASKKKEPIFDMPADNISVFKSSSSLLSKDEQYSFAKFKLLERGGSIKKLSLTTGADLKRKKHEEMTKQQKNRRLVKLQEKRENNVKIIDFEFEKESSPDSTDMSDDEFVYDIFVKEQSVHEKPPLNGRTPIIESFFYDDEDELENEELYSNEYDSDDSNAENNPHNEYGYLSDTDDYAAYTLPGEEHATLPGSDNIKERPDYAEESDQPYEIDSEASEEFDSPFRQRERHEHENEDTDEEELMDFLDTLDEDEENGMQF
uniref:Transcription factor Iwr1 domain-containing protein n=1 Tax=Percolomonas cosmopolitus TaxID=63605 RepID=A0A7S1KMJ2_9EUKA|mmetsp:Transcript_156/g.559  ORF Transcript_156/g.559 Transcript_156/m.559 type:complete len:445 (+) Transcript_156:2-1336(+)